MTHDHGRPGTVYINIGDGGNREGRYDHWLNGVGSEPNPVWSAARRPEFGHGKLTLASDIDDASSFAFG